MTCQASLVVNPRRHSVHYIHSQLTADNIKNTLKNNLQQATYTPIEHNCRHQSLYLKGYCLPPASKITPPLARKDIKLNKAWRLGRLALPVLGLFALAAPNKSLTNVQPLSGMEKINITKTLTVAATPEHLFVHDGHMHGLGYDVANRYADHLGAELDVKSYEDEEKALRAIKLGEADILISNNSYQSKDGVIGEQIACQNNPNFSEYGLNSNTGFIFNQNNTALIEHAKGYLCNTESAKDTSTMAKFYRANALDSYSVMHFNRAMKERLPLYQYAFKSQAKKYGHDWQLLVAIGYQESHLEPAATSRTGVQGIMMLTNDTAAAMGVEDRTDAVQSIEGGARYLSKLKEKFSDVPESERLWFVLAAYNMGPYAVRNIQEKIAESGENPDLWSNFYTYLSDNAGKNSRYVQCMHYVTNIRTYFEALKLDEERVKA